MVRQETMEILIHGELQTAPERNTMKNRNKMTMKNKIEGYHETEENRAETKLHEKQKKENETT